jgi:hypothetical protein
MRNHKIFLVVFLLLVTITAGVNYFNPKGDLKFIGLAIMLPFAVYSAYILFKSKTDQH